MREFYKLHSVSIIRFLLFVAMWLYIFWFIYSLQLAFQQHEGSGTQGEAVMFLVFFALIISFVYLIRIIMKAVTVPAQRTFYVWLVVLILIPIIIILNMLNIKL